VVRSLILWLVLAVLLPDPSAVAVGVARASDPWQDDAALNDVCFLGRRLGWIAGEHGVLWATRDEGTSWSLVGLPVGRNVSLRSVCFLTDQVGWLREQTELPICVGFGISRPEQVRQLAAVADGVIVGSAIVAKIATVGKTPGEQVLSEIGTFADQLVSAL